MNSIKVKIIRIGNSKGIRLSKSLIEQYNMKDEVLSLGQEYVFISVHELHECLLVRFSPQSSHALDEFLKNAFVWSRPWAVYCMVEKYLAPWIEE